MLEIDTESSVTFLGLEEQTEERNRQRIKDLLDKRKEKQQTQNYNKKQHISFFSCCC
jgi:hypothetical protein